eukprot:7875444-Lingulodinium_polyedra.AAC.1
MCIRDRATEEELRRTRCGWRAGPGAALEVSDGTRGLCRLCASCFPERVARCMALAVRAAQAAF